MAIILITCASTGFGGDLTTTPTGKGSTRGILWALSALPELNVS